MAGDVSVVDRNSGARAQRCDDPVCEGVTGERIGNEADTPTVTEAAECELGGQWRNGIRLLDDRARQTETFYQAIETRLHLRHDDASAGPRQRPHQSETGRGDRLVLGGEPAALRQVILQFILLEDSAQW